VDEKMAMGSNTILLTAHIIQPMLAGSHNKFSSPPTHGRNVTVCPVHIYNKKRNSGEVNKHGRIISAK
jgi:hypothetical protein